MEYLKSDSAMNDKDEINILKYLVVILRRMKMIVVITISLTLLSILISLIMTPIYRAETRILAPQSSGSGLAAKLLGQLGELGSLAGGVVRSDTPSALYIDLLRSRTILDGIVDEFGVMELYDTEYREEARRKLLNNLVATEDKKSGIITVAVEDEDPRRAAEMANAFILELKKMTKVLAISKASQSRLFFEDQMEDAKRALVKAEDDMKGFQQTSGALKIEEQTKVAIEGIAALSAQISAKQVELRAMKTFLTDSNPEVQEAEEQLKGMKAELRKLEELEGKSHSTLLPTRRMPELGTEYLRKLRDLKYSETLHELLLKQYEVAKLNEAQDAIIIQVIDEAIPPEKRVKPRRKLIVILTFVTGFFLAIFAAFIAEYVEKASADPENRQLIEAIRKSPFFKKRLS